MDEEKRSRFFDPYHQQRTQAGGRPLWFRFVLSLISVFGSSFCLTCLYLAMRGIMRLGGFVASGGPYEIAHPAPRYVWIFPVSIFLGLICLFLHAAQARWLGGLNLLALAWPALFISLGRNFLEFGFHPPGGEGLACRDRHPGRGKAKDRCGTYGCACSPSVRRNSEETHILSLVFRRIA